MTEFDGAVDKDRGPLARAKNPREPAAPGRWVNPILGVLGTLVLSGYLMTGLPPTPAATAPAPLSDERPAPAYSQETGNLTHSGAAQDKSTVSSMTDLLKTAFSAALALAWAVGGAWLGMRRARTSNRSTYLKPIRRRPLMIHCELRLVNACTMRTRLVPQYLRCVEFPATKRDLVRLAREHIDEGRTLRRLECLPDRRYSSLHDLITEIRID